MIAPLDFAPATGRNVDAHGEKYGHPHIAGT
jgi:hypothetical protein